LQRACRGVGDAFDARAMTQISMDGIGGLLTGACLSTSLAVSSLWPPPNPPFAARAISRCVITFKCCLLQAQHMCDCRGKGLGSGFGSGAYRMVWQRGSGVELGWVAFGQHMDKGKARQCRSCAAYKCLIYASKMLDSQPKKASTENSGSKRIKPKPKMAASKCYGNKK